MYTLYYCVLAAMCFGMTVSKPSTLDHPHSIHINVNDDPQSFDISWKKVANTDAEEPVLGYKVKVIEVKKIKRIINKANSTTNTVTPVEVEEYPKINAHKTPEGDVTVLTAAASDNPVATFNGYKLEAAYEFLVNAYTKTQEGPWSAPIRVRVHDDHPD